MMVTVSMFTKLGRRDVTARAVDEDWAVWRVSLDGVELPFWMMIHRASGTSPPFVFGDERAAVRTAERLSEVRNEWASVPTEAEMGRVVNRMAEIAREEGWDGTVTLYRGTISGTEDGTGVIDDVDGRVH